MARTSRGGGGNGGRNTALVFFAVGVAFLLLIVFGPVVWGERFDGEILFKPAIGLIVVGVYVAAGVWLPSLDWAGLVTRVLLALIREEKGGDEDGR